MWLDFDARILRDTAGEALQRVNDQSPWLELIDAAVFQTQEQFVASWVQSTGYRLEVTDERPTSLKGGESREKYIYLGASLGLTTNNEGIVTSVTPDGVGDGAGMFEGLKIVGVEGLLRQGTSICWPSTLTSMSTSLGATMAG